MEPVAVAARSNTEVWVVNHLSDSVSIVDLAASPPRVVAHAARRRRAARHRLRGHRRQPRVHHHRAPRPAARAGRPGRLGLCARAWPIRSSPSQGIGARRRLGLRRDQPRHHARRHAGAHPDASSRTRRARSRPTARPSTWRPSTRATRPRRSTSSASATASSQRRHRLPGRRAGRRARPATNCRQDDADPACEQSAAGARDRHHRQVQPADQSAWRDTVGRDWNVARPLQPARPRRVRVQREHARHAVNTFDHVGTILFNMVGEPGLRAGLRHQHRAAQRPRFEGPGIFGGSHRAGPPVRVAHLRAEPDGRDGRSAAPQQAHQLQPAAHHAGCEPRADRRADLPQPRDAAPAGGVERRATRSTWPPSARRRSASSAGRRSRPGLRDQLQSDDGERELHPDGRRPLRASCSTRRTTASTC